MRFFLICIIGCFMSALFFAIPVRILERSVFKIR
jgi:hypothetical protein